MGVRLGLFLSMGLALMTGCGADEGGAAQACAESTLVSQCPPGSNPILGATAGELCEASADGNLVNMEGAVSGRCFGEQTCRVACQFSSPCRCGVDRITSDGVFCIDCDTVSACGDGVCADGETPQTCQIDCGAVCTPGDMQCDGAAIQSCNLSGRFDTLACPTGEVCVEIGPQQVECERDDVIDLDAGGPGDVGGDAGDLVAEGRILLGPGSWPGSADTTPPEDRARPARRSALFTVGQGTMEVFGQRQAGHLVINNAELLFTDDADAMFVCSPTDTRCYRFDGWLDPVGVDDFCAALRTCLPLENGNCEEGGFFVPSYPRALASGAPFLRCVYDYLLAGDCPSPVIERDSGCPDLSNVPVLEPERGGELSVVAFETASPSSRHVVTTKRRTVDGRNTAEIWTLDMDTGLEARVINLDEYLTPQKRWIAVNNAGQVFFVANSVSSFIRGFWSPGDDRPSVEILEAAGLDLSIDAIREVALSPNGQAAAVVIRTATQPLSGNTVVYNLTEDTEVLQIIDAMGPIAFSPRNHQLAVTFPVGDIVEVWELDRLARIAEAQAINKDVGAHIAFSPSGGVLATWNGSTLSLWDVETSSSFLEEAVTNLGRQHSRVRFSRDGAALWAYSTGGDAHGLWVPAEGTP